MDKIINGKEIAKVIKEKLYGFTKDLSLKLVVIQVSDDEASNVYVLKKEQLCKDMNIEFVHLKYDYISQKEIIDEIEKLNNDDSITGILVQLPLPEYLDKNAIINAIDYKKDVDGLTSVNLGKLYSNQNAIIPCTALGIMEMLKYYNVSLEGKNVCIIGRTKLVGIPLFKLLLDANCTVTMCHSKTVNLKEHTNNADILVVAAGKKHLITKEYIKENAIIIDVGINRCDGKLYGDADYDDCFEKCSMITPVPGGVGPMTVAMLINNIIECKNLQEKKN